MYFIININWTRPLAQYFPEGTEVEKFHEDKVPTIILFTEEQIMDVNLHRPNFFPRQQWLFILP